MQKLCWLVILASATAVYLSYKKLYASIIFKITDHKSDRNNFKGHEINLSFYYPPFLHRTLSYMYVNSHMHGGLKLLAIRAPTFHSFILSSSVSLYSSFIICHIFDTHLSDTRSAKICVRMHRDNKFISIITNFSSHTKGMKKFYS